MSEFNPQPIPRNRSAMVGPREELERLRYQEVRRSNDSGGDNTIIWVILAPLLLIGLFLLLGLIVSAGAGIETAVTGG